MGFKVATYNVLASAYINRGWYPHTTESYLSPAWRVPAVAKRIRELAADILCLQEVEAVQFKAVADLLEPLGYHGQLALKGRGKPDGCATFFRTDRFDLLEARRIDYDDGNPTSGHIAQVLLFRHGARVLGVANTHLRWDPPQTPLEQRIGYRQARQLLDAVRGWSQTGCGWVVCGDLNVEPDSDLVGLLRSAGMDFSHRLFRAAATSNTNGRTKMLDYVFHNNALSAVPLPLPALRVSTPMPGPDHPSDHLPVVAEFEWVDVAYAAPQQSGFVGKA